MLSHAAESHSAFRIGLDPAAVGTWLPGQHVDIRLTAEDGYQAERSYSIASAPESSSLDLVVERIVDGEVSTYLTDVLRVGDQLELRGPIGGYFVWSAVHRGPLQLLAGGSGVAPFLAMLDHHAAAGSDAPVRLLYSARTEGAIIARDRLEQHRRRGVGVDIALTREQPPGWDGLTGRVTADVLSRRTFGADEEPMMFVCGPTAFVEAVADALVEIGHPPEWIRTERFGGAEPDA